MVKKTISLFKGIENQPVSNIKWVPRESLHGNSYNPNHVFPVELKLLRISILLDGWTQPIVARSDGEIIDGYHRWLVAEDPEIMIMTDGLIPVASYSDKIPIAHQKMSTIRHNRARGSHGVLKMADLVVSMKDEHKLPDTEIRECLGMEQEEIDRLYDHGNMRKRGAKLEFSQAWEPEFKGKHTPEKGR